MKFIQIILLLILTQTVVAQSNETSFRYLITVTSESDRKDIQQMLPFVQGSTMDIYCTPTKSRMDLRLGNILSTVNVVDHDERLIFNLNASRKGNFAYYSNYDSLKVMNSLDAEIVHTGNTSKRLGYNCEEVLVISGKDTMVYWITNEIDVKLKDNQMVNPKLPGFPVYFSRVDDEMVMTFELIEFKDKFTMTLEQIFFLRPPEGYQLIAK